MRPSIEITNNPQPPARTQPQISEKRQQQQHSLPHAHIANEKQGTIAIDATANNDRTIRAAVSRAVLLTSTKEQVLKIVRRNRAIWITIETLVCVVILVLLVLHSYRLNKNQKDNAYVRWSSSWVMVLLSILLVVSGFAIFITVYYYRTVIVWVNDPRTTDEEAQNPRARNAHKFSWTFLKSRRRARSDAQPQSRPPSLLPTYSSYHRHLEVQHQYQQSQNLEAPDMQRPWLSMRGKNPRAWRQMRANERLHHQWGGALQRDSSMSSTSLNNMSLPFGPVEPGAPRRPPQTGRHQKVPGTPAPL